jgi:1-acyl-sn-glycerol-3-phosphate acyltransferase
MPGNSAVEEHASSLNRDARRPRRDASFDIQAPQRPFRLYRLARSSLGLTARLYSRVQVEGAENISASPALYCFSHQCWVDPMYVLAAMPGRPRVYFFGPQEEDMRQGVRNRLMRFFGLVIPFAPGARGLLAATHRTVRLVGEGASIAIAGEGRIHCGESALLPLKEGAAYIALRAGIPLIPVAVNGTGWLGFRRTVRLRFGAPLEAGVRQQGRPHADEVAALTARTQSALELLVKDFDDRPPSGAVGRWITELFNGWPGGTRPAPDSSPKS